MNVPLLESELVERSIPHIPNLVRSDDMQRFTLDREVGVGSCIADVVLMASPANAVAPTERLTVKEAVVLSQLRRHGATRIDLLEKRCRVRRGALREGELRRIISRGIISVGKGGRIGLSDDSESSFRIVAIEAKLQRWRDALKQAVEYQRYADYSYVLLPAHYANEAVKNRTKFLKSGVGLWVFENDKLTRLLDARQAEDHCWRREFVLSRMANLEEQTLELPTKS